VREGGTISTIDRLTLVATVALPIAVSILYPAIPDQYRLIVGVTVGILVLAALTAWLARSLRREIRRGTASLTSLLTGYLSDIASGTLFKGAIRNASLRVSTIHQIVDVLVAAIPDDDQRKTLRSAGYEVGRSWGRDFRAECRRTGMEKQSLADRLSLWAHYDSMAGLGRFEFALSNAGYGSVILRNGFLSQQDCRAPLDYFFAGYIEGTLEELLGRPIVVDLEREQLKTHEEAVLPVAPSVSSE
jgi:hypothetical protein